MKSEKKYATALVLFAIGGSGGLHRFYVGRWRSGLLYLLTCGFFGIGYFYDLVSLLRKQFEDKYGFILES